MIKEMMSHNAIIDLPLFSLMLFVAIFLGVVLIVWRRGKAHPEHVHLASLPLADDTPDLTLPTPTDTDRGGAHGRR